jgi:CO/xanthine dehydrogenase Mo-binding subunit
MKPEADGPLATPGAARPAGEPRGVAPTYRVVGTSGPRIDGPQKLDGRACYVDDLSFPGMLHAAAATSEEPHALLLDVDVEAARKSPGVLCVLTAEDVPGQNQVGVSRKDQPLMARDKVRWVGDRLAILAAESAAEARAAARKVKGRYQRLPGVFDVETALDPETAKLHDGGNLVSKGVVRKGDAEAALLEADVVISNRYQVDWQEHAYLETQGCVAVPDDSGAITIHGSMQCPFYVQTAVADVLGIPLSRVQVVQAVTGGGFGGKEDYPSELAACAALLAWRTCRPVKMVFNREEDFRLSTKREKMVVHHTLGAKKDGTITAVKAKILVDAGAYAGLSVVVAERGNSSAVGPYRVPNVQVDTLTAYTCNPFGGAFRGFGHPQVAVAHEAQVDELARQLGRDPADLRLQNLVEPGDQLASGEVLSPPVEARLCFTTALERVGYEDAKRRHAAFNAANPTKRRGLGLATIAYGGMLHACGQSLEGAGALVQVHRDGSVSFAMGHTELGQGAHTVVAHVLAEALGIPLDAIHRVPTDTRLVPDCGPTVASRTTAMSGHAVLDAARQLREVMVPVAAEVLECWPEKVEFVHGRVRDTAPGGKELAFRELAQACFLRKVHLAASGWYAPPRKLYDPATGQGQAYSHYAYATHVAEVEVDLATGQTQVLKMTCVHDVGKAIYRDGVLGQIEGGVVQGMGYALMERLVVKEGRILTANFTDYLIPTTLDIPEMDIVLVEESPEAKGEAVVRLEGAPEQVRGPYGAKGIGEPSLIPVAPAIRNAVSNAIGFPVRLVPCTPERVMDILVENKVDPYAA